MILPMINLKKLLIQKNLSFVGFKKQFPLIYEVGKGADESKQPILSEFNWRNKKRGKKKKLL